MRQTTLKKIVFIIFLGLFTHILNAQTVYVTESGKKYHKKNCTIVKEGKKGLELKEASKQGYTACAACKPDAKEAAPVKKAEATDPKKKK